MKHLPCLGISILALAYFLGAKLGLAVALGLSSPVWPAAGIALAAIVLGGPRIWPGILLGSFLADLTVPVSPLGALGVAVGATLEALLAAYLFKRCGGLASLRRARDILLLVLVTALVAPLSATVGNVSQCLIGYSSWAQFGFQWMTWWLGDLVGVIVVAPLILSWSPAPRWRWNLATFLEGSAIVGILLVVCGYVFLANGDYPLDFLVLPLFGWAAFRLGLRELTAVITLASGLAAWGTTRGTGPFAIGTLQESLILLQSFMGVAALFAMVLAAGRAEQQATEAELREILKAAPEAIVLALRQDRIDFVSDQVERIFGYRPFELIGSPLERLVTAKGREAFRRWRDSPGKPIRMETVGCTKDGRDLTIDVSLAALETREGSLGIAIIRDISDQKRAEERLRLHAAFVEYSSDAVISLDPLGRVTTWNPAAERMLGYSSSEILGRPVAILIPPDRHGEMVTTLERLWQGHPSEPIETVRLRKDGTPLHVSVNMATIPDETGKVTLFVAIMRDLTEIVRAREDQDRLHQVEELNRLKDTFLSAISHELKTPLSLITGYAELLQDRYPTEELLAGILDGTRRITAHLNNVLDYSALLSGSLPIYPTELNFEELVQNARAALEEDPEFQLKHLNLVTEIAPRIPLLNADARRIAQALHELLRNAVKFTPAYGTIGLRIASIDDRIRLEVWDTGYGLTEPEVARLGAAFTQREVGVPIAKGGLGLGLAIVQKLAKLHGGWLEIASQPGQGSRFTIVLPIA